MPSGRYVENRKPNKLGPSGKFETSVRDQRRSALDCRLRLLETSFNDLSPYLVPDRKLDFYREVYSR